MQVFEEGRGTGWQHIYFNVEYETTRDGSKVGIRYKIKWAIDRGYYFGFNLVADVWTEGNNYGRQIKANYPNKGSGEALFPEDGGYYWFDKGYGSNEITGCRVIIKCTNGGTPYLDSGEDRTLSTPIGYIVSSISNNIDFIIGNNIPIKINDITNQGYNYVLSLDVLDDSNNWINVKSYNTTSKDFTLTVDDIANTLYSKVINKNFMNIRINLNTYINENYLGYTTKEGICYVTNSNPDNLDFIVTNMSNTEITGITTGFGPYNNQSNLYVKVSKVANDNGLNSAKLKKAIIQVGNRQISLDISELIGTGTKNIEFDSAFSEMKENELVNNKAPIIVSIIDSRGNKTSSKKEITIIGRYVPAYFTELELKRTNGIDEGTRLIGRGKTQVLRVAEEQNIPWITYTVPINDPALGDPMYNIDKSYITFDETTETFTVDAPIYGDLGASGYTKDKEFEVNITLGDYWSQYFPPAYTRYVRKGKVLMHYGKKGIAFGSLYDENIGGPLQVDGIDITKRFYIGSQILAAGMFSASSLGSTCTLLGAYQYNLIDGVFGNITIPEGYHKEYRITFQGRTDGDGNVAVGINNIWTDVVCTWSLNTMRHIASSRFFKESDIILEPTYGYSQLGINLKILGGGNNPNLWDVWNIMIHGYLVKD